MIRRLPTEFSSPGFLLGPISILPLRYLMDLRLELNDLYCLMVLKKFPVIPCERFFSISWNTFFTIKMYFLPLYHSFKTLPDYTLEFLYLYNFLEPHAVFLPPVIFYHTILLLFLWFTIIVHWSFCESFANFYPVYIYCFILLD